MKYFHAFILNGGKLKMKIGLVVESYENVPHETEQINVLILKRELEKLGHEAYIIYFRKKGDIKEKNCLGFSDKAVKKINFDGFYLSGKISNSHFIKLTFNKLSEFNT